MKKILFIVALASVASCSKNKEEALPKTPACQWYPLLSTTQIAYTKTNTLDSVKSGPDAFTSLSTDKEEQFGEYIFSHNNCNEITLKTSFSDEVVIFKKDGETPSSNAFELNGVKFIVGQYNSSLTNTKRINVSIHAPNRFAKLFLYYEYGVGIKELEIDENSGYNVTRYVRN